MDYQKINQDLSLDYMQNCDINQKYDFSSENWHQIYAAYINFPNIKSRLGSFYVCNEIVANQLISDFKNKLENVEHLLPKGYFTFDFNNYSYLEILHYKIIGGNYEEINFPNFDETLKSNLLSAQNLIEQEKISVEAITQLFKIISKDIIEFHPVQGANMYRAVDLAAYNEFDRLIFTCSEFHLIIEQMQDLVELCELNPKRDEYANFLLSHVIKAQFLKISPFYRFNELMAELIVVWFLKEHDFTLNYLSHQSLFNINHQKFYSGLEQNRFSFNERDLSFWIKDQIEMIIYHLQAFDYIKKASDISIADFEFLTSRERDYIMTILCSHLREQFFNWEMINDELKRSGIDSTKAGVLKILNRLVLKEILITKPMGKSKLFRINL